MEASNDIRQRNIELVTRGMGAYNRGDIGAVLEFFSPEIEVYAPPTLMNAGVFHGHDGFMEWIAHWNEAWESFKIHIERVEAVGDDFVVMEAHQVGRGRGSGVSVEQDIVYVYEVDDGRCVHFSAQPGRDEAMAHIRGRQDST